MEFQTVSEEVEGEYRVERNPKAFCNCQ